MHIARSMGFVAVLAAGSGAAAAQSLSSSVALEEKPVHGVQLRLGVTGSGLPVADVAVGLPASVALGGGGPTAARLDLRAWALRAAGAGAVASALPHLEGEGFHGLTLGGSRREPRVAAWPWVGHHGPWGAHRDPCVAWLLASRIRLEPLEPTGPRIGATLSCLDTQLFSPPAAPLELGPAFALRTPLVP